jgi:glutamate-5-semialdehyde dehydrogenase
MKELTREKKDNALRLMARHLRERKEEILQANEKDVREGERRGLSRSVLDRLTLNPTRLEGMAKALEDLAGLPDPVGEMVKMWRRPNGLWVGRMRIPLGVIFMIYESRPNVTSDAAGLCFKSGNAVILRGGSEAHNSNRAIVEVLQGTLRELGFPEDAIQVLPTTDRETLYAFLELDSYISLVIPRGGEEMIQEISRRSKIPVLKHDRGVCHVYVDRSANLEMATKIVINAKTQRPSVCNAMETLLVDQQIASRFLPMVVSALREKGVEIKGCPETRRYIPDCLPAQEEDFYREYLDLKMNIKVVKGLDEAVDHIERFGSRHTDAIVTEEYQRAMEFIRKVDSSLVLVNASTRFNDGGELGLGAEIGISTTPFHAFGPMALEELTVTKFVAFGEGQIRT